MTEPALAKTAWSAIAIDPQDNVAVALRDLAAGDPAEVNIGGAIRLVTASEPIALGHKIAIRAIAKDSAVIKYGAPIARALTEIAQGQHVHVHNIASNRARFPKGSS